MPRASRQSETQEQPTTTEEGYFKCECCEPPNNLILRPDLGGMADDGEHAKFALCVLHQPTTVYEWNGEKYEQKNDLRFEGNRVLDQSGQPYGQPEGPPSLIDLEADDAGGGDSISEGGSQPRRSSHVNLEDDEYY